MHQYADLGDPDRALDRLAASFDANPGFDPQFAVYLWHQSWDGLRDDPRFLAAAGKAGLPGIEPARDSGDG